jgi:hypothetical protein
VITPISTSTCATVAAAGVTDCNGQAQFSVTDTVVETLTLTACDTGTIAVPMTCTQDPGGLIDQTATVSFTADEANQSHISASPATLPAGGPSVGGNGGPVSTVTVTLLSGGRVPLAGHVVALSASSPTVSITPALIPDATSHCATQAPAGTSDCNGQAAFTVGDSAVESVDITALDLTTGSALVASIGGSLPPIPPLVFTANENNQSTITAVPEYSATLYVVTVTLVTPSSPNHPFTNSPLVGHHVTLTVASATPSVPHGTVTVTGITKNNVTTAAGQIQFDVRDTATQTLTITASDTGTTGHATPVTLYKPLVISIFR